MVKDNKGFKIEKFMMKLFKGEVYHEDCVDFQTKNTLYEVKSCKLFLKCSNQNNKRPYLETPHKKIYTTQLGRFYVNSDNHEKLKIFAEKENKKPKYIFVLTIGKQKIRRIKSWKEVGLLIDKRKHQSQIRLKEIFNNIEEEE